MNREGVAYARSGIYKSIRKLRAQHGRDLLAGGLEGLAECISRIAALRAHVTRLAPIDTRITKRIAPIQLQELGH